MTAPIQMTASRQRSVFFFFLSAHRSAIKMSFVDSVTNESAGFPRVIEFVNLIKMLRSPGRFLKINMLRYSPLKVLTFILWKIK